MQIFKTTACLALMLTICGSGCQRASTPTNPLQTSNADARALCSSPSGLPDPTSPIAGEPDARALIRTGEAYLHKARLQSDAGFYLNVGACADLALELSPEDAGALELRGLAWMNSHRFEAARALAAELLLREPERASAFGLLADALLELGRFDEALVATQRQISIHPDMAAHARASYLRWLAGDMAGALRLIKVALVDRDDADPESAAWTFVEAANLYWHLGNFAAADSIYAEALQWVEDYPPALAGRGRVALALGRPVVAAEYLQRSLQLRPLVETAWRLGDAWTLNGDATRAAVSYADAERIGRRGDRLMLATFLAAQDRSLPEALRLLDIETQTRASIYLDDARAWTLYRLNRFPEALAASDRALRLGTRDARLLFHAGAIRIAIGDRARGTQMLEQALALNPAFELAGAAQARALLAGSAGKLATVQ